MDPREALNITIKAFGLKAADIARETGITVQTLSRYRKKHQDMTSLNAFQAIKVLPSEARDFFWQLFLLEEGPPDLNEKVDLAKSTPEIYRLLTSALSEKQKGSLSHTFLDRQEEKEALKRPANEINNAREGGESRSASSGVMDLKRRSVASSDSLRPHMLRHIFVTRAPSTKTSDLSIASQSGISKSTAEALLHPEASSAAASLGILIESLIIEYLNIHLERALREELTEKSDRLELMVKQCLTNLINQDNLASISKKKPKKELVNKREEATDNTDLS